MTIAQKINIPFHRACKIEAQELEESVRVKLNIRLYKGDEAVS